MKPRHNSNENSEDIKADIENTRARMDGTLDELTERLKPRHLLDDVLDYFQSRRERGANDGQKVKKAASHAKETAGEAGRVIVRQIKRNPIPSLLIGAGLAWLLMDNEDEDSRDGYAELYSEEAAELYYAEQGGEYTGTPAIIEGMDYENSENSDNSPGMMDKMKDKGSDLKERTGRKMRSARRRAASGMEHLRDKTGEMTENAKERSREMYSQGVESFKRTADEHPLATAAGFLAVGLLAGMLLPSSRKENELMGPTRDRVVRRTRDAAEEAVERGKHVAEAVVDAAKSEAREQGLTPASLKEKGAHVVESVKSAAREEGLTPDGMKEKVKAVSQEAKQTAREESKQQTEQFKANV